MNSDLLVYDFSLMQSIFLKNENGLTISTSIEIKFDSRLPCYYYP